MRCWPTLLLGAVALLGSGGAHAADALAEAAVNPGSDAELLSSTEQVFTDAAVLVSAAEKVGRELRYSDALKVSGEAALWVWKLAEGTTLDAGYDGVAAQLDGDVLFSCTGRDCGRSTSWANLVFGQPLIYGQDRYQRYRVVRAEAGGIHALYAIRRGNRRVHLLLQTVLPEGEPLGLPQPSVVQDLREFGLATLSIQAQADGALGVNDLERLDQTGATFAGFAAGAVYVVCHLYGADVPQVLLDASRRCAADAAARLQTGYDAAAQSAAPPQTNRPRPARVNFEPFGAGPLLPRPQSEPKSKSRIELVVPALLGRD